MSMPGEREEGGNRPEERVEEAWEGDMGRG